MTIPLLAIAAAALVGGLAGALYARRRARSAVPAPAAEPDVFDGAFSLASIARRAREEAARAGRAAADGRPIAHRLEDLPGRRWIVERIEERIGELRRDLVVHLAEIDEQAQRLRRETQDHRRQQREMAARAEALAELQRAEAAKPRHEQDLAADGRLGEARRALEAVMRQLRESELRHDQLDVARHRLPVETDAEIAYLHEACDTLVLEHDMAYEVAEHLHPDKRSVAAHVDAAPIAGNVPLAVINERAARAGAQAGRTAALRPDATAIGELPSRRWITERFAEHLAALRAQAAAERRAVGEELAVIRERLREADRAAAAASALIEALEERRTRADRDERSVELARDIALAERELHAAQGRRHEHELERERLMERQRQIDEDYEARADFLNEARAAAHAEHDLAFQAAMDAAHWLRPASERFHVLPEAVPDARATESNGNGLGAAASANHH